MNTIAIDTHKTIMKLKQKGYTEEQAEGFVEALTESELVTTGYLDNRLNALENSLQSSIKDLRTEMYRALLIHGLVIVGAILAAANIVGKT